MTAPPGEIACSKHARSSDEADGRQAGLTYLDSEGAAHDTHALAPDFTGCGHPDPDHSYSGGRIQYDGGAMDGFAHPCVEAPDLPEPPAPPPARCPSGLASPSATTAGKAAARGRDVFADSDNCWSGLRDSGRLEGWHLEP